MLSLQCWRKSLFTRFCTREEGWTAEEGRLIKATIIKALQYPDLREIVINTIEKELNVKI